ncbi:DoxX family protein [Aeromicrobium sp. Leaf350]|uniref:DoxX family protein n=1 Tax=Aeromicrobium sp. Leaf350 TaxID=2876565 RepID=UPI001E600C4C|nr:DoxX family protein [Aeromicrobium sp. Leaf350]
MSAAARSLTTPPKGGADLGLLLGRVVVGVAFVAHGWQKWSDGIGSTQAGFDAMGIPAADAAAIVQASLEVGGGALLVLGALTPLVSGLLGLSMLGAAWFAHRDAFFVADGGAEFVLVLAAASFLFALVGPGRFSVDAART